MVLAAVATSLTLPWTRPYPAPIIGVMSGFTSIAPMTIAEEF